MYSAISALSGLIMNVALREEIAKLEQLEKHYEKSTFEVVSSVLRTLLKKTIISVDSFQRQVVVASLKDYPRLIDFAAELDIPVSRLT